MKVRLGYVAISKSLEGITSSSSMNYTNYLKKDDKDQKLYDVILSNLIDLDKIISYNIKNHIHFFRITSALVPLATHQEVNFDYITPFLSYYEAIGAKIKEAKMRTDFHPGEYTILNSTRKEVIENTVEILKYHFSLLKAFQIETPLLVLHVGSNAFGKVASLGRFKKQFQLLPTEIQNVIALENDDKVFTVEDLLPVAESLQIPLILDFHHHLCNGTEQPIETYLPRILKTWGNKTPKMHFSSPKNKTKKEMRSHHDYIDSDAFLSFLEIIRPYFKEVDVMIEAKMKDEALFRLMRVLKYKSDFTFLDETSFETH